MHKVKVDMVGFEHYTGLLGSVPFTNGISDRPITDDEASRLGASVKLVKVDNNEQVGAATIMANARNLQKEAKPVEAAPVEKPRAREAEKQVAKVALEYDRDKLEEIASEGGIKAVRKIADTFDVKGVQINALIEGILEAQTKED